MGTWTQTSLKEYSFKNIQYILKKSAPLSISKIGIQKHFFKILAKDKHIYAYIHIYIYIVSIHTQNT